MELHVGRIIRVCEHCHRPETSSGCGAGDQGQHPHLGPIARVQVVAVDHLLDLQRRAAKADASGA